MAERPQSKLATNHHLKARGTNTYWRQFDHKTKLKINQHKEQDKDIKYQEQ